MEKAEPRTKLTDVMKSRGGIRFEQERAVKHKCALRTAFEW